MWGKIRAWLAERRYDSNADAAGGARKKGPAVPGAKAKAKTPGAPAQPKSADAKAKAKAEARKAKREATERGEAMEKGGKSGAGSKDGATGREVVETDSSEEERNGAGQEARRLRSACEWVLTQQAGGFGDPPAG